MTSFITNLENKIKNKSLKVISFDFFDTLVARKTPLPRDIFYIIGHRLRQRDLIKYDISPERFTYLRIQAETNARKYHNETTLGEIYNQFPPDMFTNDVRNIINIELETEKEFIFPISDMVLMLKLAARRGKKIIVVSDTYLSKEHLRAIWGNATPKIEISFFVSSEFRTGKSENLFEIVLEKLRIPASALLHVGDNYNSDVESPSMLGIETAFMPNGSAAFWNTFYQEVAEDRHFVDRMSPTFGDLGITALRSKMIRYANIDKADSLDFTKYGSQILGAPLSLFIQWVLANAKQNKISVLIPLMREGYLISKMLEQYPDIDHDIKIRPAYLSRRILFQSLLLNPDENKLRELRFQDLNASVEQYVSLLGLNLSEAPQLANIAGRLVSNETDFETAIKIITTDQSMMMLIHTRAEETRNGIIKHITKIATVNGILAEIAIVIDLGWNGTIQKLLQRILDEENINIRIVGLYMMTTPSVNSLAFENIAASGLFVDGGYPASDFRTLSRTLEIFEQSCSPPHGSIQQHDVRTAEPILNIDLIPSQQRADIEDIQNGVLAFHKLFIESLPPNSVKQIRELANSTTSILRRAMLMPSQDEIELFKNWQHDDNLGSCDSTPIMGNNAIRMTLPYQTVDQFFGIQMSEIYWPFGALALSDPTRSKFIALAHINGLPINSFDIDTCLSSELSTGKAADYDSGQKSHQRIYKNSNSKTFLRFIVNCEENDSLRWTPTSCAFDLLIDFIVFSFRSEEGVTTRTRIEGSSLYKVAKIRGMTTSTPGTWRGPGWGSAFYFEDLRQIGVSSQGQLSMDIACSFADLNEAGQTRSKTPHLSKIGYSVESKIRSGTTAIDIFNGKLIDYNERDITCIGDRLSFSGWMIEAEKKHLDGEYFAKISNQLGEVIFVPLKSVPRPDVASQLSLPLTSKLGFEAEGIKLPSGIYNMSIILAGALLFVVSEISWSINMSSENNNQRSSNIYSDESF